MVCAGYASKFSAPNSCAIGLGIQRVSPEALQARSQPQPGGAAVIFSALWPAFTHGVPPPTSSTHIHASNTRRQAATLADCAVRAAVMRAIKSMAALYERAPGHTRPSG